MKTAFKSVALLISLYAIQPITVTAAPIPFSNTNTPSKINADENQHNFQEQYGIHSGTIRGKQFLASGHSEQPIHGPHSEHPRRKKDFSSGKEQNFGARFENDWNSFASQNFNENHVILGSSGSEEINKPFDDISDFAIDPFTGMPYIDAFTGQPIVVPMGSAPLIDSTTGFPIIDPSTGLPIIRSIVSPTKTTLALTTTISATTSTSTRTSARATSNSSADNMPFGMPRDTSSMRDTKINASSSSLENGDRSSRNLIIGLIIGIIFLIILLISLYYRKKGQERIESAKYTPEMRQFRKEEEWPLSDVSSNARFSSSEDFPIVAPIPIYAPKSSHKHVSFLTNDSWTHESDTDNSDMVRTIKEGHVLRNVIIEDSTASVNSTQVFVKDSLGLVENSQR